MGRQEKPQFIAFLHGFRGVAILATRVLGKAR